MSTFHYAHPSNNLDKYWAHTEVHPYKVFKLFESFLYRLYEWVDWATAGDG